MRPRHRRRGLFRVPVLLPSVPFRRSLSVFAALLAHMVAGFTGPRAAVAENPRVHAIRGATVVVSPETTLDTGDLLVRDGRILAVGPDETVPPDAWVWEREGRWVYPALVDAHVALEAAGGALPEGKEAEERPGGTHPLSRVHPELHVAELEFLPPEKREAYRKAGFATLHVVPDQGIFRGQGAVVVLGDGPLRDALLVSRGPHQVALESGSWGDREYPNSLMGAVALVRQTLLDARWHEEAWRRWERGPVRGERPPTSTALEALRAPARGREPVVLVASGVLDILRLEALADEFELDARIVGTGEEYQRLDAVAAGGRPLIVPVVFPPAPVAETLDEEVEVGLAALRHWDRAPSNPAWLHQAGLEFALTSHGLDKPTAFLDKVRRAVERGLPETAALDAVTRTPARLLGLGDRVGTLEPGRLANLLVTDGPLFEEGTHILEIWVDGERYPLRPTVGEELEGNWEVTVRAPGLEEPLEARLKLARRKGTLSVPAHGDEEGTGKETEAEREDLAEEDPVDPAQAAEDEEDEEGEEASEADEDEGPGRLTLKEVVLRRGGRFRFSLDPEAIGLPAGRILVEGRGSAEEIRARGTLADGTLLEMEGRRPEEPEEKAEAEDGDEPGEPGPGPVPPHPGGPLEAPGTVLVRNATLWTSGDEGILEGHDMLVRNGRIAEIGRDLAVPRGARILEAEGRPVTPGLVDAHSHAAIQGGVNESTRAITSEVRIEDVIQSETVNIYRMLAGGLTTMHLLHGSANPIGGQAATVKLRWGSPPGEMLLRDAAPTIKFALGENVKQSNWGDDFRTRYPQTRMGVEQFFREQFLRALDYRAEHRLWNRGRRSGLPPRRDLQLEALVEVLEGERLVHCHSYRQDEILMLIRVAEEFGFTVGTFQHVLEGYKVADEMAAHGAAGSTFSDWWAYKFEVYDAIPYNGALMWDRGVNVSFNSDSTELARRMNLEAAKAVKYGGVPRTEAFKFVTLNPAIQVGAEDRIGSLEPGKDADFVLWSGDPLSTRSVVEQTWLDGKLYFDRGRDLETRREREQERRALLAKAREEEGKEGRSAGKHRRPYTDQQPEPEGHVCFPREDAEGVRP